MIQRPIRVLGTRPERWGALVAALSVAAALGCVGEGPERKPRESDDVYVDPGGPIADTVSPLGYQVFESQVDSEAPRKVTYRLLVLQPASRRALSKTIRVALDSLVGTDTSLVAARAVLYTGEPVDRNEVKLLPRLWATWIPPEGWEDAGRDSRGRVHRTYVYDAVPGWAGQEAADGTDGGGSGG